MADQNEAEEIKQRLNIVEVIAPYVSLKKAGRNHKGLCPFHREKTPSFMVSEEKQIYKCFGCGEGGDVYDFVMKIEGLEFPDALKMLAERAGVILKPRRPLPAGTIDKTRSFDVNRLSALLWHKILMDHPAGKAAKDYLKKRKLIDETLRHFLIGFVPAGKITGEFLAHREVTAAEMAGAGHPEKFFARIMFPIFDVLGNIAGFSGRALKPDAQPKYLNTPETAIYHKSRILYGLNFARQTIKQLDQSIVVEGQMDVVLSHQIGIKNAVASSGTALTIDHLEILRRLSPNITLAFDQDEAGIKATKLALELALPLGLNVTIVSLDNVKDAGEAIAKDPKIWITAIKNARPAIAWLVDTAFREIAHDKNTRSLSGIEKKKIAGGVLPYLAKIADPVEQAHYLKALSIKLDVEPHSIERALAGQKRPSTAPPISEPISRNLDEELLGLILTYPDIWEKIDNAAITKRVKDNQLALVYSEIAKCYHKEHRQLLVCLKPNLPEDLYKQIKLLAFEAETANLDPVQAATEAVEIASRLKRDQTEKIKSDFASAIARAEKSGDRKQVKTLLSKLQEKVKGIKNNGKTKTNSGHSAGNQTV